MWKNVDSTIENRNSNPSWLAILNAGNFHTEAIAFILFKHFGFYEFISKDCNGIIGKTIIDYVTNVMKLEQDDYEKEQPLRCLDLSLCKFDLDTINPNKEALDQLKLRYNVFGNNLFYSMLKGYKISEKYLYKYIKEYISHTGSTLSLKDIKLKMNLIEQK